MNRLEITGKILARNTVLNLIAHAVPIIAGIATIPFIVRGLGTERFGLLSLVWVILGYFTIFDLGLGRATTKYVAEALGKGEADVVSDIVWTAVTIQAVLGLLGTIIVALCAPLLTERILNISPALHSEATATFYVLALSVPVVLISSSFSGLLAAAQRFDLVNAVKIPSSVSTFILPLVGIFYGFTLSGIVTLILVARVIALLAFAFLSFHLSSELRRYSGSISSFRRLLTFGGWITVSNIIGPVLQYLDRFLIGAILTVSVVAYYTAPFDAISQLWIIPGSLAIALFPAFSTLGLTRIEDLRYYFIRAAKYVFVLVGPIVLILLLFSYDILSVWLGTLFAENSSLVFQILLLGVLFSSLTHLAISLFQGVGKPAIAAKIQLLLLPLSVVLCIILIKRVGIVGAALSWTACRLSGMLLTWKAAGNVIRLNMAVLLKHRIAHAFVLFLVCAGLLLPASQLSNMFAKSILAITVYSLLLIGCWHCMLDKHDRDFVHVFLNRLLHRIPLASETNKGTPSRNV